VGGTADDDLEGNHGVAKSEFTQRLGEAGYGQECGHVGVLNLLARAGLPVPEGTVLTHRAHEEFLRTSGILRNNQAAAWGVVRPVAEMRSKHASCQVAGELNREVCEALIELNAKTAVVLSWDLEKGGLGNIPEVRDAVREAWLSPPGLERQIAAIACGGDLPTWPVLVQREPHPQYKGWSTIEGEASFDGEGAERRSGGANIALYDVEYIGEGSVERKSIASFTLEARYVLGEAVKIRWGLEDGRWYVLSACSSRG
jgi:hypothetical protein